MGLTSVIVVIMLVIRLFLSTVGIVRRPPNEGLWKRISHGWALLLEIIRMLSLLWGVLTVIHVRLVGIWKFLAISPKRRTRVLTDRFTTRWTRLREPLTLLDLTVSRVG